jgi:hypothetical protein
MVANDPPFGVVHPGQTSVDELLECLSTQLWIALSGHRPQILLSTQQIGVERAIPMTSNFRARGNITTAMRSIRLFAVMHLTRQ